MLRNLITLILSKSLGWIYECASNVVLSDKVFSEDAIELNSYNNFFLEYDGINLMVVKFTSYIFDLNFDSAIKVEFDFSLLLQFMSS